MFKTLCTIIISLLVCLCYYSFIILLIFSQTSPKKFPIFRVLNFFESMLLVFNLNFNRAKSLDFSFTTFKLIFLFSLNFFEFMFLAFNLNFSCPKSLDFFFIITFSQYYQVIILIDDKNNNVNNLSMSIIILTRQLITFKW